MFDFLFIGNTKRLKNRLNVRSFVRYFKEQYMKKAIITGITGQDGSYLAELLLNKNYEVHGLRRRASSFNTQRLDHIYIDPHFKTNFFSKTIYININR